MIGYRDMLKRESWLGGKHMERKVRNRFDAVHTGALGFQAGWNAGMKEGA